jgi:UDP-glucuronate 4-epimerase
VVGVDSLDSYYQRPRKLNNLTSLNLNANFRFIEGSVEKLNEEDLFDGVSWVFHQAGQPGVRRSWGQDFSTYVSANILATQRLLEMARNSARISAFVAASSSSVYGNQPEGASSESNLPRPLSPYGVSKLASEHLCSLYGVEYGVPTVSLRYFTVYGPRQRPDMAIQRLFESSLRGEHFYLNGDGDQLRDFTYVSDVVQANLLAAGSASARPGAVFNVGGGSPVTIRRVIEEVERLTQRPIAIVPRDRAVGDPSITHCDSTKIREQLGWSPSVLIEDGLQHQYYYVHEELRLELSRANGQ